MFMRHASRRAKITVLAIIVLLLLGGAAVWYFAASRPAVMLPQDVISKTLFPVYVPSQLPKNFYLKDKSIVHDNGVLLFELTDGDGHTIAVTEQSIPAKFDFDDFYKKQVKDPRTLSGTPFHSVMGETIFDGVKMVSIRAENTWVMVSGQHVGDAELELIAKNLKKL